MLSSRINRDDDDDDDDNEGESTMPGDYQPWTGAASRIAPSRTVPPPRPVAPSMRRPSRRPTIVPPTAASKAWPPVTPVTSPARPRRARQRSITPEIVIERRHHHHHHSSSGQRRVITIPLDNRPTLGLRGPPKRVLEIERVRCRRRRKHRSSCYEMDYGVPPQSNMIVANPLPNPCLLPVQSSVLVSANNSAASLALFSNLTPEMIQNLPRRTVHLPPVHLPGSQADANTELDTVIFPAEIINPIDGTLSIIQSNSTTNVGGTANIQTLGVVPGQPQLINVPTNVGSPLAALEMASGPFMQQVQDLFQRMTLSQPQPTSSPFNHPIVQPSLPVITPYNAANNSFSNLQPIPPITTTNTGSNPSANIQSAIIPNRESYNPTTFTPSSSENIVRYRPANITPYQPTGTTPYAPANITPYQPAGTNPYGPANITPYQPAGTSPYAPANITPYQPASTRLYRPTNVTANRPAGTTPYSPANITPYQPTATTPYSPANITPYQPTATTPYSPANITPYQTASDAPYSSANITPYHRTNFTPSNPTNSRSYYPISTATSNSSNSGPYRPANITPYSAVPNRSGDSSMLPSAFPSASIPNIPSSSLASSDSFNSSPSRVNNRPLNMPYSSQSLSQTPYQSNMPRPKSILRNAPSNRLLNTSTLV